MNETQARSARYVNSIIFISNVRNLIENRRSMYVPVQRQFHCFFRGGIFRVKAPRHLSSQINHHLFKLYSSTGSSTLHLLLTCARKAGLDFDIVAPRFVEPAVGRQSDLFVISLNRMSFLEPAFFD